MADEQTQPAAEINIGDIQSAVRHIDYAVEQGVYKSWAMYEQAYTLRNRLDIFVNAVLEAEEAARSAKDAADAAQNDTVTN